MKRRHFFVGFMLIIVLAGVLFVSNSISANLPTLAEIETLPLIIVDPGHGGIDGGAVSDVGDVVEKDINLAMSLILRDLFRVNGFGVIMTRDTDISIYDDGVKGTRKQKMSDLNNRLTIADSYPNAVFISIHQNKFGKASSWGTQVFYGPNHKKSVELAELVQKNIVIKIQPDNKRKVKRAEKNLYLMYAAKCPAILVECGFLSNTMDVANLTDTEYQSKICFAILSAVLEYLDMDQNDGAKYIGDNATEMKKWQKPVLTTYVPNADSKRSDGTESARTAGNGTPLKRKPGWNDRNLQRYPAL